MNILLFILSLFGINGKSRTLKKQGQQVFAGFLAYRWSQQSYNDIRKYVDACVDAGFTGITFELMELMADWPRGQQVDDVVAAMQDKVKKIGPWIGECKRAGLWARIIINNSNGDVNKKLTSPAAFTKAADEIKKQYGEENLLILPVSEKDGDLSAGFRSSIISHCEAVFSKNHTIAYADRRPDAMWYEKHMKDPLLPASGDWTLIAVSDTGDILRKLHSDGVTGDKSIPTAWENFVRSNLTKGVSVCCYAFHKKADYSLLKRLGAVIKGGIS
jgi:hypothetical protein